MRSFVVMVVLATLACARPEAPPPEKPITPLPAVVATQPPASSAPALPYRQLLPVDEATRDPSLVAFRESLIDVVKRRDREALMAVLDPNIRNSFGGDGGIAAFREQWKLDDADSDVWTEFGRI